MPSSSSAKTAAPIAKKAPLRAKAPARRAVRKSSRPAGDKRVTIADIAPAKKAATAKAPATASKAPAAAVKSEKKVAASVEEAPKVVRDGFTMPQVDYAKFKSLKALCLKSGVAVKKSELLRAGLYVLEALPAQDLLARIAALPPIKAGRKKKKD